jgi:N-formylglutamate amidohydrolase
MVALPGAAIDITPTPFEVLAPRAASSPFVFASPHSGSEYPDDLLAASRLDAHSLRKSEDSFVDELFGEAPAKGALLIRANFPRAYLDVNREAWELDPTMFQDDLPDYVNTRSYRVAGGLGTIARVVSNGAEIYGEKLKFAEAVRRINELYLPYHRALADLLESNHRRFKHAVLIDCHSMPSVGGPMDRDSGHERAEIVLGDRYGTSCLPILTDAAEEVLTSLGYTVRRNTPYAGGYITRHYGRPADGIHALQIEINRALYMDEANIRRLPCMKTVKSHMTSLIETLCALEFSEYD